MDLQALKLRPTADLAELADQLSPIGGHRLTRHDLLTHILNACAENQEPITGGGTLEIVEGGFGFLRGSETSYLPANSDIYVSPSQVKRFSLRTGDSIHGVVRRPKDNERYLALLKIVEINGRSSDEIDPRGDFDDLTPMLADEVLQLEHSSDEKCARLIDLLCPIGFGDRVLISAPSGAGKTTLIKEIAQSINDHYPDVHLLVTLIDERPEEITLIKRALKVEVLSSRFDEPKTRHIQLMEIVLDKAKRLVESGQDVVLLIDSLTRLTHAYQAQDPQAHRPFDELKVNALTKMLRIFGAAQSCEEGGSLTLIATALKGTSHQIDSAIYEELKRVSNAEIQLSGDLAMRGYFPSIDPTSSRSIGVENLLQPDQLKALNTLKTSLIELPAIEGHLKLMRVLESKIENE